MEKTNLSIYLIKEEYKEFDAIQEKSNKRIDLSNNMCVYCKLKQPNPPKWLKNFFANSFGELNGMLVNNASVLLLIKKVMIDAKERIFGLTFGYGKSLFKDDVLEEQFGLKVVLNTVEKSGIRKISKVDVSKNYKQSQEQLPNENDFSEFGFDVNTDLIKYVSGKSNDKYFEGAMLTGGDILSFSSEKNIDNINEILDYVYELYLNENYKKEYPWLDNIKKVRNVTEIEELNKVAVNYLNEGRFTDLWLAIPEIIQWEKIDGIQISGKKNDEILSDIYMDKFMETFAEKKIQDFNQLKSKTIKLISSETNEVYKTWKANKCLVGTVEYNGKIFSINSGVWYQINKEYKDEIAYESIKLCPEKFIECPKEYYENDYINALVDKWIGSDKMHTATIFYGGGKGNQIEVADIFYKDSFIHIKNNGGSSMLSHLFNQSIVSATLMKKRTLEINVMYNLKKKSLIFLSQIILIPKNIMLF